jgi:peptidoglycan/LPS O-acetylase OafA/YrhL
MANYYVLFWDPGMTTPKGTGVLWSLAVEEHFYLVYPFVFLVLKRAMSTRQVGWLLLGLSLLVLGWRYVLVGQPGFQPERTFYATDTRIDSIMWGCILAMLANPWGRPGAAGAQPAPLAPGWKAWAGLVLGLLLLGLTLVVRDAQFRETLRYTLQGLALMPIFHFAVRYPQVWLMRPLNWGFVMTLGVYSYAIYLIHFVAVFFLQQNVPALQHWLPLLVATMAISVLFAAGIERFVESRLRLVRARIH